MYLLDQSVFQPILLSLKVALMATLFSLVIGLVLARLLTRKDFLGKSLLESLIILPMVLPPSVTGYLLLVLFGRHGFMGVFLKEHFGLQIVFTWLGAVLASTIVSIPLMYQNVKGAFLNVDHSYERAARTLGANDLRVFWTVTLPMAWTGIISGLVLSFSRALGEFGATLMVAGNIPGKTQTIPLAIYFAVDSGDQKTANTLVLVITVFSLILVYSLNLWLKRRNYSEKSKVS